MLRSPSLIVRRARAGNRKEIIICCYHQPSHETSQDYYMDLLDHGLKLTAFATLLSVSITALNRTVSVAAASTTDDLGVPDDADPSNALRGIWATCWVLLLISSCFPFRFLKSLPGRRAFELALVGALSVMAFAALSTIGYGHFLVGHRTPTHYDRDQYRWAFGVIELVATAVLAGCAVVNTILFRTINGLYAPIAPSTHAPTLIPIFLTQVAWTILLCLAFGLTIHPDHQHMIETINILKICAFSIAMLHAWGQLCITTVIQKNGLRRSAHPNKIAAKKTTTAPMPTDVLNQYKRPSQTPTNDV